MKWQSMTDGSSMFRTDSRLTDRVECYRSDNSTINEIQRERMGKKTAIEKTSMRVMARDRICALRERNYWSHLFAF